MGHRWWWRSNDAAARDHAIDEQTNEQTDRQTDGHHQRPKHPLLWQGLKYQIFNSRSPQLRYTNICNYNLSIITRINDFFSCFHRQTNIQSKLPFHDKLFHVSRLSYKLITHTVITTSFVSYYIQFSTSYYCLENTCKLMFEKYVLKPAENCMQNRQHTGCFKKVASHWTATTSDVVMPTMIIQESLVAIQTI